MNVYHCTVCKTDHSSESLWLEHLTRESHQVKAQRQCLEEWGGSKVKQCCLVVYSSFPLTGVEGNGGATKLIHHFAKDPDTFVTDFVCWKERPGLAVVQFGSRAAVKKVRKGARGRSEIVVDNEKVEIRAGEHLGILEWMALLPDQQKRESRVKSPSRTKEVEARAEIQIEETPQPAPSRRTLTLELEPRSSHVSLQGPASERRPAVPAQPSKRALQLQQWANKLASSSASSSAPPSKRAKTDNALDIVILESEAPERLLDFTKRRGWTSPLYKYRPRGTVASGTAKTLWTCEVIVNEVTYNIPDTETGVEQKYMEEMKAKAAAHCLQVLTGAIIMMTPPPAPPPFTIVNTSDQVLPNVNSVQRERDAVPVPVTYQEMMDVPLAMAFQKLRNVAERLGWPPPVYSFDSKVEKKLKSRTFWTCSVTVNGIKCELPDGDKWAPKKIVAQQKVAVFYLEKLSAAFKQSSNQPAGEIRSESAVTSLGSIVESLVESLSRSEPTDPQPRIQAVVLNDILTYPSSDFVKGDIQRFERATPILLEYCLRRGWNPPTYNLIEEDKSRKSKVNCQITVNGVTYEMPENRKWMKNEKSVKKQITAVCLHRLTNIRVVSLSQQSSSKNPPQSANSTSLVHPIFSDFWKDSEKEPKGLSHQFYQIQSPVVMMYSEFHYLLQVWGALQTLFREAVPTARVVLLRNCHLRLNHPGKFRKPLFYVYDTQSPPFETDSITPLSNEDVTRAFQLAPDGVQEFVFVASSREGEVGSTYLYKNPRVFFNLVNAPQYFVEAQVCRLLEYMITFDPRCYPIITLLYYWVRLNKISFGEPKEDKESLSEPLCLQWLVIHYFCKNGFIPSVRDIQARTHQVLKEQDYGADVGFNADPEFAQQWRKVRNVMECDYKNEQVVLNLLQLFANLLCFYGDKKDDTSSWIINTNDGEMLNVTQFLAAENPSPPLSIIQNMIQNMSSCPSSSSSSGAAHARMNAEAALRGCSHLMNPDTGKLSMTHPFIFTRRFTLPQDISAFLKAMHRTGGRVREFIDVARKCGTGHATGRFGILTKLMTLDEVTLHTDLRN